MILPRTTESDAKAQRDALNANYTSAEIIGTVKAVAGQLSQWSYETIPAGRVAEFDASDSVKQENFMTFSKLARAAQNSGKDFVTAWEEEYSKVYP